MGGGNGQKAKMAREKNLEKQKGAKGSQLQTNKKAMSIQLHVAKNIEKELQKENGRCEHCSRMLLSTDPWRDSCESIVCAQIYFGIRFSHNFFSESINSFERSHRYFLNRGLIGINSVLIEVDKGGPKEGHVDCR